MRFALFFLTIFLMSCNSNNQTGHHKYDYPGLGMIIDAYYQDHYDYPKTIHDLLSFIDAIELTANFDTTIAKLKKNRDEIIFNLEKNTLIITIVDSVIFETVFRSPCDELSYNTGFYLGKVLFFNEKGQSIISEETTNEFKNGMKDIRSLFKKVKKDGDIIQYVILNFSHPQGLTLFCDDNISLNDYKYFQEVQGYINVFSEKYYINRIIFASPIFLDEN